MKKIKILLSLVIFGITAAQVPNGYYNSVGNKTGQELKTALSQIIKNGHLNKGYNWDVYTNSDRDIFFEADNTLLDIYSENPNGADPYNYNIPGGQCGNVGNEGKCYNREHTIPQSTFNEGAPMRTDYHHVLPTDGKVNGMRDSYPYGEVATASWTSQNGSKLGNSKLNGYSGTVFEPINEFKGDIARIYFYFATRYENEIQSFNYVMYDGSKYKVFKEPFLSMLIKWHQQDPVSEKEIKRNNAVYNYQKNRNPYVDNPTWVASIFGTILSTDDNQFSKKYSIAPNPVKSGSTITVNGTDLKKYEKAWIYNLVGQMVQEISQPFKNGNTLQLNKLPKGVYILKTDQLNTKFIIE